jgi:hypothetical protein
MLGLVLKIGGQDVYTVMFWLEQGNNGESILKVGALQGHGKDCGLTVI